MKLEYFGHSCFSLRFENGPVLVTDPFDESVGYPLCTVACDAALVSHDHFDHNHTQSLTGPFETISAAGDYEIGGARIRAMESFHDDKRGALRGKNLLFRVACEGLSIAHLGDLGHLPDAEQKSFLENLDLLLLPIGGTYTIDTPEAEALLRLIRPRHAVAMHYRTEACGFNIRSCADFAKDMSAVRMPREIEFTRENLMRLPDVMIMNYK